MVGRDPDEEHRASTPLELLFDLCFVVAVASAAAGLHHALAEGHVADGLAGFGTAFFAIWWAWVNFTWFASAYDTDDVYYRLLTLVQIAGVLVLAAGIPGLFRFHSLTVPTIGYLIMRIGLILQWLRAAREHEEGRPAAIRYAAGLAVVQVGWLLRLALPGVWGWVGYGVMLLADVMVPVWAEVRGTRTTWHPGHIAERYGLFTLIVLGECVLGATAAVQAAISDAGLSVSLLVIAGSGLVLLFAMWWSYFKRDAAPRLREDSLKSTMIWAYSHYGVFGAVAALGAGIEIAVDTATHHSHITGTAAALCVAIPVVVYLLIVGVQHKHLNPTEPFQQRYLVLAAALVLLSTLLPLTAAMVAMALITSALVAYGVAVGEKAPA